ncbi:hypothetical protein BCR36DRAFT_404907 [Piromyces finnis]|uniref:Dihydrofolate reductase n=1 Tax=Piromyces finnis TaxID=1754191 RepID=A0A1Y1V983_9FUNG|nr:hypothetical protein BCR36DRAFT_404907 [Piromyces finnis]|eukprot:ORX48982.1 hypothetical protein BCR36DRAFT_404907 [Piromyces finnis]
MTIPQFSMIVAAASNKGIGKGGKIPWRIPEDVRYFKNITCLFRDTHTLNRYETKISKPIVKRQRTLESVEEKDKPVLVTNNFPIKITDNIPQNVVVMGRNTWESIPEKFRPMPNRINVVLSRNKEYAKNLPKEVQCYLSLKECLENLSKQEHGTIFLIGGGQIYKEGIQHPSCENLFITNVKGKYDCDTFFPEIPSDTFKLNDNDTIEGIFLNSMKNCEWVRGVQTNAKSGIKFEFQIYSKCEHILDSPTKKYNVNSLAESNSNSTTSSIPTPSPSLEAVSSPSYDDTTSSLPSSEDEATEES